MKNREVEDEKKRVKNQEEQSMDEQKKQEDRALEKKE